MSRVFKSSLLFILFAFCFSTVFSQGWTIKAKLTGFRDSTIFYLLDPDTNSNLDSAVLKKGQLFLKGQHTAPPAIYWLTARDGEKFYYTVLLFGNERLVIKGDKSQFPFDLSITGSKSQNDFNRLLSLSSDHYKFRNKAMEQMMAFTGDDADHRRDSVWAIVRVQDSLNGAKTRKFIADNINTYAAISTLFYEKDSYSTDSLRGMMGRVSPEIRNSSFGMRIDNYLKIGAPVKVGDDRHDFTAYDSAGEKHSISQIKGKYILLDFSSTYCGPCVESVPELKDQARKYSNDLELVTVSGDMSREIWLKGMVRDNPNWLSLWDGKGSYSETLMKYGVNGFPTFCLIDPNGKIVNISVGYGKDEKGKGSVETMLAKYINAK